MTRMIPTSYRSWFPGDRVDGSSTVLGAEPYRGRYPEHFTHVLRLAAPRTRRGWIEQAVDLRPARLPARLCQP